jgi:cellulose synthase/poly-beta-1,6-N-acetylglucosamine synthase-like glycosyltransferase
MISICIPVFNFDVRDLVKSLHSQCKGLNYKSEIIVIDDCSGNSFREINSEINSISKYIQLEKNIGRSKIRNLFLQYAAYDYLLFLDCDSIVISSDFIKNYIESVSNNSDVIVGGRIYPQTKPERNKLLRWKYCLLREQKPQLNNSDYKKMHFLSNNFLIRKSLFEKIRFDERITGYGHEDTLFAYELKKSGIVIKYINNPVMNGELENNKEFIQKTEKSIDNLKLILEFLKFDKGFISEVILLKNYFLIKRWRLELIFYLKWKLLHSVIKRILVKGIVNLFLFDFYKIGYLIHIMRASNKTKTS